MPGRIDCYIDCTSPYSYFALLHLRRVRPTLLTHHISVSFHPVFLGGINVGSGNEPPWKLPAKARYSDFDRRRACRHFGVPYKQTPDFFPILSVGPMRCMIWVKENVDQERYEGAFEELFKLSFVEGVDVSKEEGLTMALERGGLRTEEVERAMKSRGEREYKDKLTMVTEKCVKEFGAFGCPWSMVTNGEGKTEPFFGSDRWHFMWEFLGIPWQDIQVLDGKQSKL